MLAARFRLLHQAVDVVHCVAGALGIDVVHAEHQRRIEQPAGRVALFPRRAGPAREVAVARGVHEHTAAHRPAARFRLHDQRVDGVLVVHRHARRKRVKQQLRARAQHQVVGRALVGRHVVGLGLGLAEDQVRRVQSAQGVDALQQFVGDAAHHAADLAVDVGVQPAEVGDAGRRAHAAEETVALHEHGRAALARRRPGRGDARRAAAEHHDFGLAEDFCFSFRLGDGAHRSLTKGDRRGENLFVTWGLSRRSAQKASAQKAYCRADRYRRGARTEIIAT